jgi:Fe-S-cluster containining protein
MIDDLFSRYGTIAKTADSLFKIIQEKYPLSVKCRIHCCDCCFAIFGVFPIEAAYINFHFSRLDRKIRRDIVRRAEKSEVEMLKAHDRLEEVFEDNQRMKNFGLGKQRVKCPLLKDKKECILYDHRPIICRVYGVPFSLKGDKKKAASYVCGISGFEAKVSYPTVKLDNIYQQLVELSKEMLTETAKGKKAQPKKANLMLPLSKVLRMSLDDIIEGKFGE